MLKILIPLGILSYAISRKNINNSIAGYKIRPYTKRQAKKLGVTVKPSSRRNKKIDVFDHDGKKLASVGDKRYMDYPSYLERDGKKVADARRKSYKKRHVYRKIKGSTAWYADNLLW